MLQTHRAQCVTVDMATQGGRTSAWQCTCGIDAWLAGVGFGVHNCGQSAALCAVHDHLHTAIRRAKLIRRKLYPLPAPFAARRFVWVSVIVLQVAHHAMDDAAIVISHRLIPGLISGPNAARAALSRSRNHSHSAHNRSLSSRNRSLAARNCSLSLNNRSLLTSTCSVSARRRS